MATRAQTEQLEEAQRAFIALADVLLARELFLVQYIAAIRRRADAVRIAVDGDAATLSAALAALEAEVGG